MRDDFIIIFRSHPKLLSSVRALIINYLKDEKFPKEKIDDIVLGLDEACTNSIRHAYHGTRTGMMQLTVRLGTVWLEFELNNYGDSPPKDFLICKEIEFKKMNKQAPIKPHGLGLIIIKRVFEEVYFNVDSDGRNSLILRTRRKGFRKG